MRGAERNIALYPWFKFFQNLLFWQAIWFLFLQSELSAAQAILFYAIYDVTTTVLEVPSGYFSDRWGRRKTLIASACAGFMSCALFALGEGFWVFALAQVAMGAHIALASGTDSSVLYESLAAEGRADEIEKEEVRAWRYSFLALAASAILGGLMALYGLRLSFAASAAAFGVLVLIAMQFSEPGRTGQIHGEAERLEALRKALFHPVLAWLLVLSILIYGFGHLPFVFGQPFILEVLGGSGFIAEAAVVSGVVTALMMLVSVATSWLAPEARRWLGLKSLLLLAFCIQILLAAGLAVFGNVPAVLLLLLRKVPDSLAQPFIAAQIQPILKDEMRATYISVRNLVARLAFAASLLLVSVNASEVGAMAIKEIQAILAVYAGVGVVCLAGLAMTGRSLGSGGRD
ncbi:MAG: MFS transporter [Boseongicola sp. SB0662_bin_57]|nr:MFS transporter [Boseongicola sp. SB0662_bin_57]